MPAGADQLTARIAELEFDLERAAADQFSVVREYYSAVKDTVEIVDLRELVPAFSEHPV